MLFPFCLFKGISVQLNKRKTLVFWIWLFGLFLVVFGCDDAGREQQGPVGKAPAGDVTVVDSSVEQSVPGERSQDSSSGSPPRIEDVVSAELPAESESAAEDELIKRWLGERATAKSVCYDILRGQFDSAGRKLRRADPAEGGWLDRLGDIVGQYELIDKRRRLARQEVYEEQISKFTEFRDKLDVNEANDISSVLLVIAKASKLAEPAEKERFLNKPFVKKCIEEAIERAAEYEKQGQWSKAYTECYALIMPKSLSREYI